MVSALFNHLCAGTHDYTQRHHPLVIKPIIIEDDSWICAEAFIGPGVYIEEGVVVGARAVVTIWLIVLFVNSLHQASIVFPMMSMNESITRSPQYRDGLDLMQILFIILAIFLFLLIYLALDYLVPLGMDLVIPSVLAMVSYHYHDYIRKTLILDNERVKLLYFTITGYFSRFILFGFLYLFDISIELTVVFIVLIVSYILSFLFILQKN